MTKLEVRAEKSLRRLLELFTETGWPRLITNDGFKNAVNDEGREAIVNARKLVSEMGAHIT